MYSCQGSSQPQSPGMGWGRARVAIIFSHFSSNVPHFCPHLLAQPRWPWLRYWLWAHYHDYCVSVSLTHLAIARMGTCNGNWQFSISAKVAKKLLCTLTCSFIGSPVAQPGPFRVGEPPTRSIKLRKKMRRNWGKMEENIIEEWGKMRKCSSLAHPRLRVWLHPWGSQRAPMRAKTYV